MRPGGIAQLVEHLLCKQGVSGSNPLTSTTRGGRYGSLELGRPRIIRDRKRRFPRELFDN